MQDRFADIAVVTGLAAFSIYSYFNQSNEAKFKINVTAFCKQHYGNVILTSHELKALFQLNNQSMELNERCRQAIVRRQCLDLLLSKENIETNYSIFTGSQDRKDYLKLNEFKELSEFFINLPTPAKEALKLACFIPINEYNKFNTFVIGQLNKLQRDFLPLGFKELDLYQVLHAEVKNDQILKAFPTRNKEEIDVWFARSLLELAVLNVSEYPLGANYLTQARTCCLLILKKELNTLSQKENYDVMYYYLKHRAKLDPQDTLSLSKLAR